MLIALDLDNTYTRDPDSWDQFIDLMQQNDHSVYLVTMRNRSETCKLMHRASQKVDGVFCTDRKAKQPFMFERGISIDVWIDDQPAAVTMDFK